jgi:hypothetical protein
MIKYVLLENENTLETYEKVVLAYSDEQAMKQIPIEYVDDYTVISIRTYELKRFLESNAMIKGMIHKMELTIEGVADFKGVYDEWHKAIELLTSLDLTLEEEWEEFGIEERVMRFANIQRLYESILGAMISE